MRDEKLSPSEASGFNLFSLTLPFQEPKPTRTTIGAAATPKMQRALKLVRDQVEEPHVPQPPPSDPAADLVAAVNRMMATTGEPRSIYGSSLLVGTIERFTDPYYPDRTSFRYYGVGGEDVIVIMPTRAGTRESARAVKELVDTVVGELEER